MFAKYFSAKGDSDHYITSRLEPHKELFRTPHLRLMYSDYYKMVLKASKQYCYDKGEQRYKDMIKSLDIDPNHIKRKQYESQLLANEKMRADDCVNQTMDMYFMQIEGLQRRYTVCKDQCLAKNKALREQLEAKQGDDRSSYFDPMASDPCMKECRNIFYHVNRHMNRYFIEDKGFQIENVDVAMGV